MKNIITILILSMLWGCSDNMKETNQGNSEYSFFVGTYTEGESQGIYKYSLHGDGTLKRIGLAAMSENPSFLATSTDKKFLVAVNEIENGNLGSIESFSIAGDSLSFINRSVSGGAHPCFVAIDKNGFVLTANYTGGNIGLLRLKQNGELSTLLDVQQHKGKGTTDRQDAPHAHSAWFSPTESEVISVDLGTNQLLFSKLDTSLQKLNPSNPYKLNMKPGAGPRHLAFHPNGKWIYVVNELDCTVSLLEKSDQGVYAENSSISTLPENYTEPNTCADIKVSSDGKYVYASNRGHNSIVIYSTNEDGSLNLIGHESTKGDGPRNFSLSPDENYLLVANQHTNNIVSFKRDQSTGLLEYIEQIEAPTPVCILF